MMFIETMLVGKDTIQRALPDSYIESVDDGLNTLFIHEDFYKGPLRIN